MLKPLAIRNQLWRLCTNFCSYRSRSGDTQGLQIPGAGFDSLAACHFIWGRWSSGKASDCKSEDRGFESRSTLQSVLVMPTLRLRTEAC